MAIGWLNVQSLMNKTEEVNAIIADRRLDVLASTETWHSSVDDLRLRLATLVDYAVVDTPRSSGHSGGVAVFFRRQMQCSQIPLPPLRTFEAICVRLTTASGPIILLNIYRPSTVALLASFFNELSSVLEVLVVFSCPVVVSGVLNIHVENPANDSA